MSPTEFTFELTVPNHPEGAEVVAIMAAHAVDYAGLDAAAGPAFVKRVRAAALQVLNGGGPACLVIFRAAAGQLTVTLGNQSISQSLPA
jgi:hypothetical protein